MRDYNHWTVLGVLCELLPQPDNRVTLADEHDQYGMPIAHFAYSLCDNDKRNIAFATKTMERIWEHAGAQDVAQDRPLRAPGRRRADGLRRPRTASSTPTTGCGACRTCSSSTAACCPTQGAANPALVIMALADRCAELLKNKRAVGAVDRAGTDAVNRARARSSSSPAPRAASAGRSRTPSPSAAPTSACWPAARTGWTTAAARSRRSAARRWSLPTDVADHDAGRGGRRARSRSELGPIDVWVNDAMATVFAAFARHRAPRSSSAPPRSPTSARSTGRWRR